MEELINNIKLCDTKPKLDAMRMPIVEWKHETSASLDDFKKVQAAFVKQLNKLKRVPLAQRTW